MGSTVSTVLIFAALAACLLIYCIDDARTSNEFQLYAAAPSDDESGASPPTQQHVDDSSASATAPPVEYIEAPGSSRAYPGRYSEPLTAQIVNERALIQGTRLAAASNLGPDGVPLMEHQQAFLHELEGRKAAMEDVRANRLTEAPGPSPENQELAEVAAAALRDTTLSATPSPPSFEPLPDLLPQRQWQPTFMGCPPTTVEQTCEFYQSEPRLWVTDLDELRYARALDMGQANLLEPLRARQALMQVLNIGVRSKKDPYTRATAMNDLTTSPCAEMRKAPPEYTSF